MKKDFLLATGVCFQTLLKNTLRQFNSYCLEYPGRNFGKGTLQALPQQLSLFYLPILRVQNIFKV